jgi:two-component system response regulator AlgR
MTGSRQGGKGSEGLIVDDEQLARDRLVRMLNDIPDSKWGQAATVASGQNDVRSSQPDVVLLDIPDAGMDGLEAARHMAVMDLPAVVF